MKQSPVVVLVLLMLGCGLVESDTLPADAVAGIYVGRAPLTERALDVSADSEPDTATYTLRIENRDGFVHGLWTIAGDDAQPTDPWEAVVTGDYASGWMVLEYHSPVMGQCHLAGALVSDTYTPEYRCAADWSVADTLCLARDGSTYAVCGPPADSMWMGLQVRAERVRAGYDRDAFGTGYSSLEDEIIETLPQVGGSGQARPLFLLGRERER